jgi:hypothetical protein
MVTRSSRLRREDWPALMKAARKLFATSNPYGVFAFGVGRHTTEGRERANATLNVFVKYKDSRPRHRVPTISFRSGSRRLVVIPNVIATGRLPRSHSSGPAPFSGLYPGAVIRTGNEYGGVACVLGRGEQATHLLTAGHLFSPGSIGARVVAARINGAPKQVVGTLVVNLLDSKGVDAAAVELTNAGRDLLGASSGGPRLADVVGEDAVYDRPSVAFRPTTHDYSIRTQTLAAPTDALLSAGPRGNYWVRGVAATHGAILDEGDSGSVLCTGDSNEFALGICVGDYHTQSVFEPVARALRLLEPSLGSLDLVNT